MASKGGYIKLHRQILDWEWYSDINTFRLFVHLLLKANYEDGNFDGRIIHRGQVITSLTSLMAGTGLTIRQIRVSLDKLKMTGEVTSESTNQYRIITIVHYNKYQTNGKQNDKQMTSEVTGQRQAGGKFMTSEVATIEEYNKELEEEKEKKNLSIRERAAARFTPPTFEEVASYCFERNNRIDPQRFIDYYTARGWKGVVDWKAQIRLWESRDKDTAPPPNYSPRPEPQAKRVIAQQYEQRDYSAPKNESFDNLYDRLDSLMGGQDAEET